MLHEKLLNPSSIAVIGGSDQLDHVGGSVLKNLIDSHYEGHLYVVNPKKDLIQGIRSYHDVTALPQTDLAIVAISATYILPVVKELLDSKGTRGFIVYAAGFSELDSKGAELERELASTISEAGGSLLGPNNIGMINEYFAGIFTRPLPAIDKKGVDFISGSGATAVFTMEAAQQIGLTFSNVFTVGNSAQLGVEDILEHLDDSFASETSSRVKMLYMESVKNPSKLLKHARSLNQKGCLIIALKAGITKKGHLAAASHTGAMVHSDQFIEALFNKAGIIRCHSRYELIYCAAILQITRSKPQKFVIVTHAGGPGVVLTDTLTQHNLDVPDIAKNHRDALSKLLFPGAATENPIDILATGTASQLNGVLEYCQHHLDETDAMIVIFGSPGLGSVKEAYDVINHQILKNKKPIFTILPSVVNVEKDINRFISKGNMAFYDEYLFGTCMARINSQNIPLPAPFQHKDAKYEKIRSMIDSAEDGFLGPQDAFELLRSAGIPIARYIEVKTALELFNAASDLTYPLVQKVTGPLHKSDAGGVIVNVKNTEQLQDNFRKLMDKNEAKSVLVQEMVEGKEVFIGAKREAGFPALLLCGAGGIHIEVLRDHQFALVPIGMEEAILMVQKLRILPILEGMRGEDSCHLKSFYEAIVNVSELLQTAPEISELDINPLILNENSITAVDVRIRINK